MNDANLRISLIKTTIKVNENEKEKFTSFFLSHPALKKEETIKQWILRAIEWEERAEHKEQADERKGDGDAA